MVTCMEQMARRILLAAFLGILVGVAVGYWPWVQSTNAPRAQLLMQQPGQPMVAPSTIFPSLEPVQLLIALLAGLVIAIPVFLISKHKSRR